jgi:hypoxanthine phosphoribosyltransferase
VSAASGGLEPAGVAPAPTKIHVSWSELDDLVARLAGEIGAAEEYDLLLAVTRGGLVPAGMLAYRLGIREILVAAVEYYDDEGETHEEVLFHHFPDSALLRDQRVLVVDEVWETGATMAAVVARVRAAGGEPTIAVLHYKPGRSLVPERPHAWAATTESWVVYPYKAGR